MHGLNRLALHIAAGCSLALLAGLPGTASALPGGWTCLGNCNVAPHGPDGDVTAPPGGGTYNWVTDTGGVSQTVLGGQDLNLGSETDGSIARSVVFSATAGGKLAFDFNYITSDGTLSFIEYAWARVLTPSLDPVALLFTARTTPLADGNAVPGPGMPPIDLNVTLTPNNIPMQAAPSGGGPNFSPLGGDSGSCFTGVIANGCGLTDWIHSEYVFQETGNFILEFGVVNWGDTAFDSAFAFAGTTIEGEPIEDPTVPEPGTLALLGLALTIAARRLRSRRA